jgi:hypothetical protein
MSLKKSYNGIPAGELRLFLKEKYLQFNNPSFIDTDPVSIPHSFSGRKDREVSGFLAATISWGRRDLILRSCRIMLDLMNNNPFEFIISADENEIKRLSSFVHRTFNGTDLVSFVESLR